MSRQFILISIPDGFMEKFTNLVNNVNALNKNSAEIKVEEVFGKEDKPKYVATPKKEK